MDKLDYYIRGKFMCIGAKHQQHASVSSMSVLWLQQIKRLDPAGKPELACSQPAPQASYALLCVQIALPQLCIVVMDTPQFEVSAMSAICSSI